MKTKIFFLLALFAVLYVKALPFFQSPYPTSVTTNTATLNVYVNLDNTYQVGYQISTNSNFSGAVTQGQQNTFAGTYNLSKPVTGLVQNTTYYIRFLASAFGQTTYSPVASFTTQSLAPEVVNVTTTPITSNSATVNYTINTNGSNSTSVIKYGTITPFPNQVTGFSSTGTANTTGTALISGLSPNTQYWYQIEATNSYGTSTTSYYNFTTTAGLNPVISNVSSSVTTNSATINYSLSAGGGTSATSKIKYGLDPLGLNTEITGLSTSGTTISGTVDIAGLTLGTTYYYQITATNEHGMEYGSTYSFTTSLNPQIIAEYNFNNTYTNVNGNTPFASNSGTTFVADRNGIANSALNLNNTGTTATIPNLPYSAQARTVSLWVKLNSINNNYNFLYSCGTAANPDGAYVTASSAIHFSPNNTASTTNSVNTWYHYVFSYDGTTSRIYKNGTLINTAIVTKNTVNNSDIFRLGLSEGGLPNYFNGAIDDLKIYNYALSASEIMNLYNNNSTLSVLDLAKEEKIKVYPNPVKDILNINTPANVKSVEIFNLSGAKVKESNSSKIDMSKLSAGIYIVKITDEKGGSTTQKIIKN